MLIIDSISDGIAVIEDGDIHFDVPSGALADDIKEGDVVIFEDDVYVKDNNAAAERRSEIIKLQNELWENAD